MRIEEWTGEYSKWTNTPVVRATCIVCGEELMCDAYDMSLFPDELIRVEVEEVHAGECFSNYKLMSMKVIQRLRHRHSTAGKFESSIDSLMSQAKKKSTEDSLKRLMGK